MRIENINRLMPDDLVFVEETTEPQMNAGQVQIGGGITFFMQGLWPADADDHAVAENIVNGMGLRMLEYAMEHAPQVIDEFVAIKYIEMEAAKDGDGVYLMGVPVKELMHDERFWAAIQIIRQDREAEDAIKKYRKPDASADGVGEGG